MFHLDPAALEEEVGFVEHMVDPLAHGEGDEIEAAILVGLEALQLRLERGPHGVEGGLHHLVGVEGEHEVELAIADGERHLAAIDFDGLGVVVVEDGLPVAGFDGVFRTAARVSMMRRSWVTRRPPRRIQTL